MRKFIPLCVAFGLTMSGCGLFGGSDSATTTEEQVTPVSTAAAASDTKVAPASTKAKAAKETVTSSKCSHPYGKEADVKKGKRVCCQLEDTGRTLATKASRTIVPNKNSKHVKAQGKEYVATYIDINVNEVSTSMTPSTVTKGNFVGTVSYTETTYQCKGKTKKEALAATNCTSAGSRRVREMINYDGKKWSY